MNKVNRMVMLAAAGNRNNLVSEIYPTNTSDTNESMMAITAAI